MLRVNISILLLISSISMLFACTSADKKADTADGAFSLAQEYDNEERYEEAIKRYQEVKNKFPYSKYATMSEIAIADANFKQESFAEAQVAYQAFKDLHPKHPQIDYVTYRLALSFFNQLPSTIDRDLTLAQSTILYFDEVINQFPNSQYVKESKEKRDSTLKMLASKEEYIADFYFTRDIFESALPRYEGLLKKYPGLGFEAKALSRAAISAAKVGDLDKSKKYLSTLENQFPNSDELSSTKKDLQ
jgi:outer membrane protein assembly factor BamD